MKRVTPLLVGALTLIVATSSLDAQSLPNFAGRWVLDSGQLGLWGKEFTATQDDKALTIVRPTARDDRKQVYSLDGSPSNSATSICGESVNQVSRLKFDGTKLVVSTNYVVMCRGERFEAQDLQTLALDSSGALTIELTHVQNGESSTGRSVYKRN